MHYNVIHKKIVSHKRTKILYAKLFTSSIILYSGYYNNYYGMHAFDMNKDINCLHRNFWHKYFVNEITVIATFNSIIDSVLEIMLQYSCKFGSLAVCFCTVKLNPPIFITYSVYSNKIPDKKIVTFT